jgi:hypothetical protein
MPDHAPQTEAREFAAAIERTEGTTASFLKELIRRSVLESLHDPRGSATGAAGDGTAQSGERGAVPLSTDPTGTASHSSNRF